jgi:16S rRNA (adenine1518-N6/adenine1519-N6)-dimethyltransferase
MKDFSTKKELGQHWLNDAFILDEICNYADIKSGDFVLEIGPGKGSLTEVLLNKGATVHAVEFDTDAVNYLKNAFSDEIGKNLQIEHNDIRKVDFGKFQNYKVVANIPYYLTSNLIKILSELANPPKVTVLLIQKEVAERVCAKPGNLSILGITAQFYWECSLGVLVPAKLFTPPPKVDSQVVIMKRRSEALFDVDPKDFFRLIKCGFSSKRKTLINSLSGGLRISKSDSRMLIESAKLAENIRPQELTIEEWYNIYVNAKDKNLANT